MLLLAAGGMIPYLSSVGGVVERYLGNADMETKSFKRGLPLPAKNKEGGARKKKSTSPLASTLVCQSPIDPRII